jgi:hypothetical protein
MHQRGEMNEFNDHSEIDMPGMNLSGSAAGKQRQQRAKAFPTAADRVDDVTFNGGIECRSLLRDTHLDLLKLRLN